MSGIFKKLIFVFTLSLSGNAPAVMVSFDCITNNDTSGAACGIGETQFTAQITEEGSSQVRFLFENNGIGAASIGDIYFDDDNLLNNPLLIDSDDGMGGDPDVDFSVGADPNALPSQGNAIPPFITTTQLSVGNDPGTENRVQTGEFLVVILDLLGMNSFSNVLDDLTSGALRIGIHGQGIDPSGIGDDDFSESFVSNPVPVPAAAWFLGSGLIALIGLVRSKTTS